MEYQDLLSHCTLCPRKCGVNRLMGETGFCGAADRVKAARASLHYWEEPCLSGESGSGTVFFSHCTLSCVFCQNYQISSCGQGKDITPERLGKIFLSLQQQGAQNINLVTPTHYVPQRLQAIAEAKKRGLVLPIVYNSSGYERKETIALLEGAVDIFLPDFKYMDDNLARRYSHAPDYSRFAKESIAQMVEQVGKPVFAEDGRMKKGVIIRHLMLPGLLADTKKIIRWIYETLGNRVYLSLMNQYTPMEQVKGLPELMRKLTQKEYEEAIDFALDLGLTQGFIQEGETASESFIPDFNGEGI